MRAAASGSIKQEDEATGGKGGAALFTADLHSAGPAECIRFEFCFSSFVCVFGDEKRECAESRERESTEERERESKSSGHGVWTREAGG